MQVTKKAVEDIFNRHSHQADVVEDLYRLAFPDYDRIEKVKGFPEAGSELSTLIWKNFIQFDRLHHPHVLPGGIWLSHGFSTNKELLPWELRASEVKVVYSEPAQTN